MLLGWRLPPAADGASIRVKRSRDPQHHTIIASC
jgi:hypothetical protein